MAADKTWVVPFDRRELLTLLRVLEGVADTLRNAFGHSGECSRTDILRARLAETADGGWQGGYVSFTAEEVTTLIFAVMPALRSVERAAMRTPTELGMYAVGGDANPRSFVSGAALLRRLVDKVLSCNPDYAERGFVVKLAPRSA